MEDNTMNINELEKYSRLRGLNLGQAEKDYYQNVLLFILYNKFSKELVFKGGTALAKCYGLNRFSEDLDFTFKGEEDFIKILTEGLNDFGINHHIKDVMDSKIGKKHKIKIEGPLHKGFERTLCSVTFDISFRENVVLEPNIILIGHHMDVIPTFEVYVMKEEEIFAEKIRAIMTRRSARDLYDLTFLLEKNVVGKKSLIEKKLQYSKLIFEKGKFLKKCNALETIWESELKSLVKHIPDFKDSLKEAKKWTESFD